MTRLHRVSGFHGMDLHYRMGLRRLPDEEICKRRNAIAEKIRRALAAPEVFLAWNSLRNWREYARLHPDLASELEGAEADLACLDEEAERRLRMPV